MPVKFFGQYLLEKNLINRDSLLDAISYQKQILKTQYFISNESKESLYYPF